MENDPNNTVSTDVVEAGALCLPVSRCKRGNDSEMVYILDSINIASDLFEKPYLIKTTCSSILESSYECRS